MPDPEASYADASARDPKAVLEAARRKPAAGIIAWVLAACVLIGAGAFVFAVTNGMARRAWQIYLVNLVYCTGLSCGTIMIAAVMVLTKANWGRPVKRLAESPVLFLPVAFLLFFPLVIGRDQLFVWIHEPLPQKQAWLNVGFFFAREGVVFLLLAASAWALVFTGIRRDNQLLSAGAGPVPATTAGSGRQDRVQVILANIYGIFFAVLLTVLAFDLIMSLDPHWYSTLFGAYYFAGSFYCGLAALIVICFTAGRRFGLQAFIRPLQLHNLGKLLLGFCLLTADFFFAQFFIIWYGNLPEETHYVLQRVRAMPWSALAWTVLIVCFGVPFLVLLNRRIKMQRSAMVPLCCLILSGMWLERFLLVAPSVWKEATLPLGLLELLVSAGFLGLLGLCIWFFLHRYPLLPVSDPLFWQGLARSGMNQSGVERIHDEH